MKNQFVFGLSVMTTSLAVKYLDRFLGANRFDVKPIQARINGHERASEGSPR